MLNTRVYLECDDCRNPFPAVGTCPSPVDGAIYTSVMLRREAKDEGWTQQREKFATVRDLCPRCKKKAQKAARK